MKEEIVHSLSYVLNTGLKEELGRHGGRNGKCMCNLCGEDCKSLEGGGRVNACGSI